MTRRLACQLLFFVRKKNMFSISRSLRYALGYALVVAGTLAICAIQPAYAGAKEAAQVASQVQDDAVFRHENPAAFLAAQSNIQSGLKLRVSRATQGSVTYGTLVKMHGRMGADERIERQVNELTPIYVRRWKSELAGIYADAYSDQQLKEFAALSLKEDKASRKRLHAGVSQPMRDTAQKLVAAFVSEVMKKSMQS